MHFLVRGALAVACITAVSGCASLITGGDLIRPGEPTGTIEVVNQTSNTIDVVLISDCDAGSYGLDRLPGDTVIPPGKSYGFTVSAGCWDVDAGTFAVGEARKRMTVTAGGNTRYAVTD